MSTLPDQLTAVGMTRPLIVSDRGLAATGLVQRIERLCPPGAPVFLDVPLIKRIDALLAIKNRET